MLSFKRTQEAVVHNINILSAFNVNLGKALESKQGIPLDYVSEIREPIGIANKFHHYYYREKIVDMIQKCSQHHQSPIEEATRNSDLSSIILRGNHKSAKTNLNAEALEKQW